VSGLVTAVHGPYVPQAPFASVAVWRSRMREAGSMPEPPSLPSAVVIATVPFAVRPFAYENEPPLGAVVSGVSVNVDDEVSPEPLTAVTVCMPDAVDDAVQP